MYLSLITSREFGQICMLATQPPQALSGFSYTSLEDFQAKMAACHCDSFDPAKFAKKVRVIGRRTDDQDRPYTVVIAGDDEMVFRLYIATERPIRLAHELSYGSQKLYLVHDS